MNKDELVRSPIEGEMKEEIAIEKLRKELGAEQMLVVLSRGDELYHYRYGYCEHELMSISELLGEIAESEGACDHDDV